MFLIKPSISASSSMGWCSIPLIMINYLAPYHLLLVTFTLGLITSPWYLCRNPRQAFSVHRWRTSFLGAAQTSLFALSDWMLRQEKQNLLGRASGIVLEVRSGRGHSLKYYDRKKIQTLWLVEPDETSVPALKREIYQLNMDTIVGSSNAGLRTQRCYIMPWPQNLLIQWSLSRLSAQSQILIR